MAREERTVAKVCVAEELISHQGGSGGVSRGERRKKETFTGVVGPNSDRGPGGKVSGKHFSMSRGDAGEEGTPK